MSYFHLFLLLLFFNQLICSPSRKLTQFKTKITQLSRKTNFTHHHQPRITQAEDEESVQIIHITVTQIKIKNSSSGKPIFEVTVKHPEMNEGETFEDTPHLKFKGESDNLLFETSFSCGGFSDKELTVNCEDNSFITFGAYQKAEIESDNMLFKYDSDNAKIVDENDLEITEEFKYFFFGNYEIDSSATQSNQTLDKNNHNIIIYLKEDYNGEVFIFDTNGDDRERLECTTQGNKEIICSGGVVEFNTDRHLYYYTGNEHELKDAGIDVLNKYSITALTVDFPDYHNDTNSCSSIYLGYKFTVTIEKHNYTDLNTSEVVQIDLENNSNGQKSTISANCTIAASNSTVFNCMTTKAGKGGKTYYLKQASGNDCIPFHNGGNCIYIYNAKTETQVNPNYAALNADKNKDLSYNKAQLGKDDYPKVINIYFRDLINAMPKNIKAGDVLLEDCSISKNKEYIYCNIYENTLNGIEGSNNYKTHEITFYDDCGNYRRGPSVLVAGTKSETDNHDDDEEEEIEHDYKNNSLNEFFIKLRTGMLILFFIGLI